MLSSTRSYPGQTFLHSMKAQNAGFQKFIYWGNMLCREHIKQFSLCLEKKYRFITTRKDVQEYPEKTAGIQAKGQDEVGPTVYS